MSTFEVAVLLATLFHCYDNRTEPTPAEPTSVAMYTGAHH